MELIARGRTADVFDLGDGRVLRRYRTGQSAATEVRVMRHLETYGYPVPRVFEADRTDMVMERVQGGTLLDQLMSEPEQYERYGRLLGDLQDRLHRMPVPAWLAGSGSAAGTDPNAGVVIVHRDLHPNNVLLSERGPVVIDWNNVAVGRASVDAAITVILILSGELDLAPTAAERLEGMRSLLVEAFLQTCGADPRDGLAEAIAYRRTHAMNTDAENRWLETTAPDCLDAFYLERRES